MLYKHRVIFALNINLEYSLHSIPVETKKERNNKKRKLWKKKKKKIKKKRKKRKAKIETRF